MATTLDTAYAAVRALSTEDRAELIRVIGQELDMERFLAVATSGPPIHVRFPDESYEAAAILMSLLKQPQEAAT